MPKMMNKALICVDVQNDFLPGGTLGVPDGDQVIDPLITLMDRVDIIILTRDWHPANHVSFSDNPEYVDGSWPTHCVMGTYGADIDHRLLMAALDTAKPVLLIHKGVESNVEQYSGFDGNVVDVFNRDALSFDADWLLDVADPVLGHALVQLSVNSITIGGLALDYCVAATALDSALNYHTSVVLEATRPVGFLTGAKAISDMAAHRVRIQRIQSVD